MSADLVVAVCTNRPDQLARLWEANFALLRPTEFLVVLDGPATNEGRELLTRISTAGGRILCLGASRGLSWARNAVLDAHPESHVLFIDDDAMLNAPVVAAVRDAFAAGAEIVGARLVPPPDAQSWPWFFTEGQMHLVGWHSPADPIKTWGACMGIDAAFAHCHGLRFDAQLGRTGRRLESGDDTSFVAAMKICGARECVLSTHCVVHDVDPARLTIRYLARRSFWQGRSEVRRSQALAGLRKEWHRHSHRGRPGVPLNAYVLAYLVGVAYEIVARRRTP